MSFAHLHVHTEFSMLDGAARVKDVVAAAAADGQPGIAITDHGVLYGVVDFYKAAKAAGVNPIIGTEAYVVDGSRFDRPRGSDNLRYHMTLLAVSQTGYRNLMKLSSNPTWTATTTSPGWTANCSPLTPKGSSPRQDVSEARLLNVLPPTLPTRMAGRGGPGLRRGAKGCLAYQDIFGRDNFFIELQDHGLEAQRRIMPDLIEIARQVGAPLLATNDAHYTRRDEATMMSCSASRPAPTRTTPIGCDSRARISI